ncbi:hypothetical protein BW1_040_00250 [Bacillus mycoides NBRC 101238 = DSM 11821]|nr:hypothetical protein BW1_040_00250 [Bacillus mycoides NBRC 101238 = DSM 11821]
MTLYTWINKMSNIYDKNEGDVIGGFSLIIQISRKFFSKGGSMKLMLCKMKMYHLNTKKLI